jgi:hypothetical protein
VVSGMIVAAAVARLLPHPPNFTPLAAMALFAGAHFDRKALAFLVPLAAMLLSDAALELLFGWGFHADMAAVYVSFVAIVGLGLLLGDRARPVPVLGAALASSILFFLATNFSFWLTSGVYPRSGHGLAACYVAALPFFGNTVAGDLVHTGIMFGVFALARRRFPVLGLSGSPSA